MQSNREQIKLEVIKIISEELDVALDDIKEETSLQNDLEADSLEAINIGIAFEVKFNIQLDDETIQQFIVVKDIIDNMVRIVNERE